MMRSKSSWRCLMEARTASHSACLIGWGCKLMLFEMSRNFSSMPFMFSPASLIQPRIGGQLAPCICRDSRHFAA